MQPVTFVSVFIWKLQSDAKSLRSSNPAVLWQIISGIVLDLF